MLDYKTALVDEVFRSRPKLYTKEELSNMSEVELKKLLDMICEGRI